MINGDGVSINNFPLHGSYKGTPLIANIINDDSPEIIARCDDSIDIIGSDGELHYRVIDHSQEEDMFLIPFATRFLVG